MQHATSPADIAYVTDQTGVSLGGEAYIETQTHAEGLVSMAEWPGGIGEEPCFKDAA